MTMKTPSGWYPFVAALAMLGLASSAPLRAQGPAPAYNPVTTDPTARDSLFPMGMEELELGSMGSRLNGLIYMAAGPGPHPTVVLLHGLPGNERNYDLAQSLRRAGANILAFSYRGAWGSGGTFSFAHTLEDVAAVVWFARSDAAQSMYRIDPDRIALVGHSLGGWLALFGAATDSTITCTAALDYANMGAFGKAFKADPQFDSAFTGYLGWLTAPGGPLHAPNGQVLTDELKAHADQWDAASIVTPLAPHAILLLSTTNNESHSPLVAALKAAQAQHLTAAQWDTDHGFSTDRMRLASTVVTWLHESCGF